LAKPQGCCILEAEMIGNALGWTFFLTGVGVMVYFLLPGSNVSDVDTLTVVGLFAAPLVFLGTAIIVFNKD